MHADYAALARELQSTLQGEVRFDEGSRALYATDASNYRQVPIGVVVPRTKQDAVATIELCRRYGAPVLPRGGGTSLCGQCCNVAVVIDFSKYMNRILEIDPARRIARVEPGVVLDHLRDAAKPHGLTFAPDPATHNHNTLGGMIGNNSCGPHSVMGGNTVDNVIELDVLTYDGTRLRLGETSQDTYAAALRTGGRTAEIYAQLHALRERYGDEVRRRFPGIPRRVSGFNLNALLPEENFNLARALVGSEGTCVTVLEATLRLVERPAATALLVLGYKDVYEAGDHVPEVMKLGPIALEGIDDQLVRDIVAIDLRTENLELLPEGKGWLLVEFGGSTEEEAQEHARRACEAVTRGRDGPTARLYADPACEHRIWKIRESGLGATAHVPNKPITWEGWEDSAVPPERLGEYLRKLRALFDKYEYDGDLYGHFGQGCVHTRIDFDLETAAGIRKFRAFIQEAAELVVSFGGSISGEHGDGQSKAELLPIMFGERLVQAFREFKTIWDPAGRMNPGKVVEPYRADENLRLGTAYDPPVPDTHFKYPADSGKFPRVMLRCVGVGECRKQSGVMCPSYMATMEEMHSTRGRARLLFEMMHADVLKNGWQEQAVHESLDLCLSCKGCKAECPVRVDMATYKAEFLAHYYQKKWRPLAAHAFGRIDRLSRVASYAPRLANFLMTHEPFAWMGKKMLGVASERRLPAFAAQSFTRWFRQRSRCAHGKRNVILWPDTFNNYYHPETAIAAAEVLESAGCTVHVPEQHVCCGRPLYEWGMLDQAKSYLASVMSMLEADIRAGTPIVVLEPACASVFRDELGNLFAGDEQAKRLASQVFLLSEYLERNREHLELPRLTGEAIVHGHCHHKSILGMDAEESVLSRAGLDYELLDSGCCGMAGSFGFHHAKYEVAMKCGERVLLPAVRGAGPGTLVIANGYSCREQIEQATGRRALHLADVLKLALERDPAYASARGRAEGR